MTQQVHKVKWQVSLSNGETFFEDKGNFLQVDGELSPYNKLLEYIKYKDVSITSLSLYTDDGRTFNLPSLGKHPKFRSFDTAIKPYKLAMERRCAMDTDGDSAEKFTTICAWYALNDYDLSIKLSIWVDENNTNNSWSLVEME